MFRLYADENFDYPVVVVLRQLGHDVVTVQEVGQGGRGIPDPAVLAYATADGRAVLTFNHKHFKRLHLRGGPHAGIISCTRDDDSAALANRIDAAISRLPSLANQFVRIVRPPTP
jgi:hypothetical protein